MCENAAVNWVFVANDNTRKLLEDYLISMHGLPLNLEGNQKHPYYRTLYALRVTLCQGEQFASKNFPPAPISQLFALSIRMENCTFSAGDARKAGYILMRDPNGPKHVLLYAKKDPNKRPSASVAQRLANAARII
jgi:hypothetical protein